MYAPIWTLDIVTENFLFLSQLWLEFALLIKSGKNGWSFEISNSLLWNLNLESEVVIGNKNVV